MPPKFGEFLKTLRTRAGYGLREFAEIIGVQASNYANIEACRRDPWRNPEQLRKVAQALMLREGSQDWDTFFLAAKNYQALPPDMQSMLDNPMVMQLLRTVGERRLNADELRRVADYVRRHFRGNRGDSKRPG